MSRHDARVDLLISKQDLNNANQVFFKKKTPSISQRGHEQAVILTTVGGKIAHERIRLKPLSFHKSTSSD